MTAKTFVKKAIKAVLPYGIVVWNRKRKEKINVEKFDKLPSVKLVIENDGLACGTSTNSQQNQIKPKRKMLRFEVHLCDHCNLNCKHCGHLSPIAAKKFVDLNVLERDFKRLSELANRKCETVDLLGGEPLLHPQVMEIFDVSRKHFDTQIQLVTNGILLADQTDEFWQSCRKNDITVMISVYPVKLNWKLIESQAQKFGVTLKSKKRFNNNVWFKTSPDLTGSQNIENAYRNCTFGNHCLFLEDGKLSVCDMPFHGKHFNGYFDKSDFKFPAPSEDDYIDIFKVNSLDEILERFTRPIPYCRFCRPDKIQFVKWELSKREIDEWV